VDFSWAKDFSQPEISIEKRNNSKATAQPLFGAQNGRRLRQPRPFAALRRSQREAENGTENSKHL